MSLDKQRQTYLLNWLKQHTKIHKSDLRASVLTGFMLSILMIAQAAFLAIILQRLIIEQQSFLTVIPYFLSLIFILLARGSLIYLREKINFALGQKIRKHIRQKLSISLNCLVLGI